MNLSKERKYKYKFFKAVLDKDYNNIPIYSQKYLEYCNDSYIKNIFNKSTELHGGSFNNDEKKYKYKFFKALLDKNYKKLPTYALKNESYKSLINNIKEIKDITKKFETDIQIELNTTPSIILNGVKKYLDIIEKKLTEYQNIPINPISIISSYLNILRQLAKNPDTEHNRKK